MERARDLAGIAAATAIGDDRLQQRMKVEPAAGKREGIGVARFAGRRQVLEPHRRLRFERDRPREAEQRGDRIEETADRRRRKRSDPASCQPLRLRITLGEIERRRGEIGQTVDLG